MKKYIVLFISCVLSISANAQFKATHDGIKTVDGTDYYIVNITGKSAADLYASTNAYILNNFNDPKAVISKIDNQMITLHGVFPTAFVAIGNLNTKHIASVEMHLSIYFKDSKVRFDPPIIDKMVCVQGDAVRDIVFANGISILGGGDITLFDKKGKAKKEKTIDSLNDFINNKVNDIISYIKNGDNKNW